MSEEDNGEVAAIMFAVAADMIGEALRELRTGGRDHVDRCIGATDALARAQINLNQALCEMERMGLGWAARVRTFRADPIDA